MTASLIERLTPEREEALAAHHAEWLAVGTCTDRADRPRAERAITAMYRETGEEAPVFVWCDSPATSVLAIHALWDSLGDSLRGHALGGSLWDSLGDSLWDSLGGSLRGSLRGSLWDSLGDSLWDSLGDSLGDSLWDSLGDSLRGHALRDCFWGQHESAWTAFYLYPELHLGVSYDPERSAQLRLWEEIARSACWWWPYKGVVIASERPVLVEMETVGTVGGHPTRQLHSAIGPAVAFADGWAVHSWHGTNVPAWVVEEPTVERIGAETNTEVRRCAIESYGWDRYLADLGVTPVDTSPDPGNPGHELRLYDLPDSAQVYDEPVRLVVMDNASRDRDGSRRSYAETVPADIASALAAVAWQFSVPVDTYASLARAT